MFMNIHLLRLRQNSSAKNPIARRITKLTLLATLLVAALIGWPAFTQAQDASPTPGQASASGSPSQAEMMAKMMELAKLNENHKLLADMAGHWTYTIKMWMNPDPSAPPSESSGSMVTKSLMGGRFFVSDVTGKMQMPGADGKMKTM